MIYHIRKARSNLVVASFTEKDDARVWMLRSNYNFDDYNLFEMHDGVCEINQKSDAIVSWEDQVKILTQAEIFYRDVFIRIWETSSGWGGKALWNNVTLTIDNDMLGPSTTFATLKDFVDIILE